MSVNARLELDRTPAAWTVLGQPCRPTLLLSTPAILARRECRLPCEAAATATCGELADPRQARLLLLPPHRESTGSTRAAPRAPTPAPRFRRSSPHDGGTRR